MVSSFNGTLSTTASSHTFAASIESPRTYTYDGETVTAASFITYAADALKAIVSEPTVTSVFCIRDLSTLITLAGGDVHE